MLRVQVFRLANREVNISRKLIWVLSKQYEWFLNVIISINVQKLFFKKYVSGLIIE